MKIFSGSDLNPHPPGAEGIPLLDPNLGGGSAPVVFTFT